MIEAAASERARLLHDAGRWEDAGRLLEASLARAPHDTELHSMLAWVLCDHDPPAGLRAAERALALDPDDIVALSAASTACIKLSSHRRSRYTERAVAYAREAVNQAPFLADCHTTLAHALTEAGKYDEAMAEAREAMELDPEDATPFATAGRVELVRGEPALARPWIEKALELDPHHVVAQQLHAFLHHFENDHSGALSSAAGNLELDPRDEASRMLLGETLYSLLVDLHWIALALVLLAGFVRGV